MTGTRRLGNRALKALMMLGLGLTGCVGTGARTTRMHSMVPAAPVPGKNAVVHASGKPTRSGPDAAMIPGRPLPSGPQLPGQPIQQTVYKQEVVQPVLPAPGTLPPDGANGDMVVPGPAHPIQGQTPPGPLPRELVMSSHPPYTIAPPDILVIDGVRLIPRPPYRVEPLEILLINVSNTLPNQPISGPYVVSPEGSINLGFGYGVVRAAGLTLEKIQENIQMHLKNVLKSPEVTVALAQFRGSQQVRGEHLIRPDGTISLGTYGAVYVAGLTLGQAKCVIEKHLSEYLLDPQVSVDVLAYNSKVYYVILDGAGFGQQVYRLPVTGNETVLDAISYVQGLAPVSSKKRIWLARPSPVHLGCNQILPVDWNAITQAGSTGTNYQIFPGDRIYVQSDPLIRFDNALAKILAPVERILGITLLGSSVVNSVQGNTNGAGVGFVVP